MRSCLTRHVFQHILHNKPLPHVQCSRGSSACFGLRKPKALGGSRLQSRCLFGFSRKPPVKPKSTDLDRGYLEMLDLNTLLRINARPPPSSSLVQAFKQFFERKDRPPLEEPQALHVRITFQHLQEHNLEQVDFGLDTSILVKVLKALRHVGQYEKQEERRKLAQLIFEELERRSDSLDEKNQRAKASRKIYLPSYLRILLQCGESLHARQLLENLWQTDLKHTEDLRHTNVDHWLYPLTGFCFEKNDKEILHTIELMQKYNIPFNNKIHQWIISTFAAIEDLSSVKRWYFHPIANGGVPTLQTNISVLRMCCSYKDFDWGQQILQSLLEREPNKESWDITFRWAAAKGKGVDEIERMMEVMVRRNKEQNNAERPDIETINGLIEIANSENDSYTAERYVSLAQKWKMLPNAQTFLLQLDYRLKVGDIDGARHAYSQLQTVEIFDQEDVPLINKLILSLCKAKEQDYDVIMRLVDDVSERQARLEPDTISALCLIHLNRNELHHVIDLLHTHVYNYDVDQRAAIREAFVQFCLDRTKNNAQAWDAYSILRQIFVETSNTTRLKLMNEFFARKRGDMAMHVFGHIRQRLIRENRPDADAYTQCLEGIGKMGDMESLEIIHNMLKLDSEIEPNTKLYNALMLAYTGCGEPSRSLEFWDDIVYSREGPTYNSIEIALQACETAPFGERQAREIWARLQRLEIEVTSKIYSAYIGALAGHTLINDAIQLVDNMETQIGCRPDAFTLVHVQQYLCLSADSEPRLGTFYNAAPGEHNKIKVEQWAREAYPAAWQDLEKFGKRQKEDDEDKDRDEEDDEDYDRDMREYDPAYIDRYLQFNIDRQVSA